MKRCFLVGLLSILILGVGGALAVDSATQPDEISLLRNENAALKKQIAALKAENSSLQQRLAGGSTTQRGRDLASLATLKRQRIAAIEKAGQSVAVGSRQKWIADSKKMVEVIDKYLRANERPPEIQIAIYDLKPMIGMSEADIDSMMEATLTMRGEPGNGGRYKLVSEESIDGRVVTFPPYILTPSEATSVIVTFKRGSAVNIERVPN